MAPRRLGDRHRLAMSVEDPCSGGRLLINELTIVTTIVSAGDSRSVTATAQGHWYGKDGAQHASAGLAPRRSTG